MPYTQEELRQQWNAQPRPIDWYSIYNWPRVTSDAYTEWIAGWIRDEIDSITLQTIGLRSDAFRIFDHCGQAQLRHANRECGEKILCRAVFAQKTVNGLGRMLDYEVPLKADKAARHGDIDLVASREKSVLCIEVKYWRNGESALKGLIEVFTYCCLVAERRAAFLDSFELNRDTTIQPVFLTFPEALSGRQLKNPSAYPRMVALLKSLNGILSAKNVKPIEIWLGHLDRNGVDRPWVREPLSRGFCRIRFPEGIALTARKWESA